MPPETPDTLMAIPQQVSMGIKILVVQLASDDMREMTGEAGAPAATVPLVADPEECRSHNFAETLRNVCLKLQWGLDQENSRAASQTHREHRLPVLLLEAIAIALINQIRAGTPTGWTTARSNRRSLILFTKMPSHSHKGAVKAQSVATRVATACKRQECRQQLIHPDFETHRQSHPKSETEGASGPTKWTSVQQKL